MLESINIQGFRKYNNLDIKECRNINFILGENNVGKTTILEAIYAWACGNCIPPFLNIPLSRGRYGSVQQPYWVMEEVLATVRNRHELPMRFSLTGVEEGVEYKFEHKIYPSELLTEYDSAYKLYSEEFVPVTNEEASKKYSQSSFQGVIQSYNSLVVAKWITDDGTQEHQYDVTIPFSQVRDVVAHKSAKYIDVLSHTATAENVRMYSTLKREQLLDEVVEELKKIYPEIKTIDMFPYPDGSQAPISIVKDDGNALPMYAYGDGVQRWFYIIGAISLYKNSIICIDEMDTGFHYSAQKVFCEHLLPYALKNNVQLFITTHNKEFITNFFEAYKDKEESLDNKISIYTLKNINDDVKVRCLDYKEAYEMIYSYNKDLR